MNVGSMISQSASSALIAADYERAGAGTCGTIALRIDGQTLLVDGAKVVEAIRVALSTK
jgi:hypothetical protein